MNYLYLAPSNGKRLFFKVRRLYSKEQFGNPINHKPNLNLMKNLLKGKFQKCVLPQFVILLGFLSMSVSIYGQSNEFSQPDKGDHQFTTTKVSIDQGEFEGFQNEVKVEFERIENSNFPKHEMNIRKELLRESMRQAIQGHPVGDAIDRAGQALTDEIQAKFPDFNLEAIVSEYKNKFS